MNAIKCPRCKRPFMPDYSHASNSCPACGVVIQFKKPEETFSFTSDDDSPPISRAIRSEIKRTEFESRRPSAAMAIIRSIVWTAYVTIALFIYLLKVALLIIATTSDRVIDEPPKTLRDIHYLLAGFFFCMAVDKWTRSNQ